MKEISYKLRGNITDLYYLINGMDPASCFVLREFINMEYMDFKKHPLFIFNSKYHLRDKLVKHYENTYQKNYPGYPF